MFRFCRLNRLFIQDNTLVRLLFFVNMQRAVQVSIHCARLSLFAQCRPAHLITLPIVLPGGPNFPQGARSGWFKRSLADVTVDFKQVFYTLNNYLRKAELWFCQSHDVYAALSQVARIASTPVGRIKLSA